MASSTWRHLSLSDDMTSSIRKEPVLCTTLSRDSAPVSVLWLPRTQETITSTSYPIGWWSRCFHGHNLLGISSCLSRVRPFEILQRFLSRNDIDQNASVWHSPVGSSHVVLFCWTWYSLFCRCRRSCIQDKSIYRSIVTREDMVWRPHAARCRCYSERFVLVPRPPRVQTKYPSERNVYTWEYFCY